jgi:hypothetical protein
LRRVESCKVGVPSRVALRGQEALWHRWWLPWNLLSDQVKKQTIVLDLLSDHAVREFHASGMPTDLILNHGLNGSPWSREQHESANCRRLVCSEAQREQRAETVPDQRDPARVYILPPL